VNGVNIGLLDKHGFVPFTSSPIDPREGSRELANNPHNIFWKLHFYKKRGEADSINFLCTTRTSA
jgi:hypothetical protein